MKDIIVNIKKEGTAKIMVKQNLTDDQLLDKLVYILQLIYSSHSVSKDFELKYRLRTKRRETKVSEHREERK